MNNYNTMAQPWSMVAPTNNRLPVDPDHPFYYKHWPANWEFGYVEVKKGKKTESKPVFFPGVHMERVVPGVNGVSQIRGELGDPSSRLGKLQSQGFIILDPGKFDYLRVYPAKYGGKRHAPKFESFRVLAGRVISEFDRVAWDNWRIKLIADGVINTPDPHFLELIIMAQNGVAERLIPSQHLPEIRKKLDAEYKRIEDMKIAMSAVKNNALQYYESLVTKIKPIEDQHVD